MRSLSSCRKKSRSSLNLMKLKRGLRRKKENASRRVMTKIGNGMRRLRRWKNLISRSSKRPKLSCWPWTTSSYKPRQSSQYCRTNSLQPSWSTNPFILSSSSTRTIRWRPKSSRLNETSKSTRRSRKSSPKGLNSANKWSSVWNKTSKTLKTTRNLPATIFHKTSNPATSVAPPTNVPKSPDPKTSSASSRTSSKCTKRICKWSKPNTSSFSPIIRISKRNSASHARSTSERPTFYLNS